MRAECARLSHAVTAVTRERDAAVRDRRQLQAKLESLEEVLKVGRGRGRAALRPQGQEGAAALVQASVRSRGSGCFYALCGLKSGK